MKGKAPLPAPAIALARFGPSLQSQLHLSRPSGLCYSSPSSSMPRTLRTPTAAAARYALGSRLVLGLHDGHPHLAVAEEPEGHLLCSQQPLRHVGQRGSWLPIVRAKAEAGTSPGRIGSGGDDGGGGERSSGT